MPTRLIVKKYASEEVQGDDSFVEVSGIKVGEIRQLREMRDGGEDFNWLESSLELVARHIVNWNWVDDEDEPMPLPSEDPSVVNDLYHYELEFLSGIIMGGDEAKN